MKRIIACLLALMLLALPAALAAGLDFTTETLADGSLVFKFDDLSLTLPADWADKVLAIPGEGGLSFYHRASYERYAAEGIDGGGFLFSLGASVNGSFSQLPAFTYLGFCEQSAMNYYLQLPSDYPAYMEDAVRAEYDAMYAQIDAIAQSAVIYGDKAPAQPQDNAQPQSDDVSADGGVTLEQARYHFEHNALPRYFYDDPANTIDVLSRNGIYRLWAAFADENGVKYAYVEGDCREILYDADGATVLQITLPKPEANTLCYRIYMVFDPAAEQAGYYTVEYDNLLGETAFLCGWAEDHTHNNYGGARLIDPSDDDALLAEARQVAELAGLTAALTPAGGAAPVDAPTDGLARIDCPQLGFSTMADPALAWEYEEGTGVYIYTENAGSIPYAIIYRTGDVIAEPLEYIREQYTPHMRQQYGEDLIAVNELEDYEIGGKHLSAGLYTYEVQGHLIDMLRLYDVSESGTAVYTAKYVDAHGEATLKVLDTAIRNFRAE